MDKKKEFKGSLRETSVNDLYLSVLFPQQNNLLIHFFVGFSFT
jgi:hypothetical protein